MYHFFYWGPLLCKMKLQPKDLKNCASLCNKKSSFVNTTLAGAIQHEHSVDPSKYSKIIELYLESFRDSFKQWYGRPFFTDHRVASKTHRLTMLTAWVNFMKAGEFNPPHVHSGCDFSSVLFIQIPQKLVEEHEKFSEEFHREGIVQKEGWDRQVLEDKQKRARLLEQAKIDRAFAGEAQEKAREQEFEEREQLNKEEQFRRTLGDPRNIWT